MRKQITKKYVIAYQIKGTDEIRLFKMTKQCKADFPEDKKVYCHFYMYEKDTFINVTKSKPVYVAKDQCIRRDEDDMFFNTLKSDRYNCKLYSLVMGNGLCKLLTGKNRSEKVINELIEHNRIEQKKQLALDVNNCIIKWNKYLEAIGDNIDLFNEVFAILDSKGVKIC